MTNQVLTTNGAVGTTGANPLSKLAFTNGRDADGNLNCVKCANCIDCTNCELCVNCINCVSCHHCMQCIDCAYFVNGFCHENMKPTKTN